MKKLVVLAMLFVAVAAWAQLTAGVTLDYMWAQDFGPGKEFSDRPILELKFTYKADDFTSVYVELEEGPLKSQGDTGVTADYAAGSAPMNGQLADAGYDVQINGLDRAYFTTDVGKQLKLPVGVVAMYGLNEWNNKDGIKVTKSEWEDYLGEKDIRTWGAQIEVMPAPMVTLRSNWAWNPGAIDPNKAQFMIGAYGTVAPITYEATYFTNNQAFDEGWIEGGIKFAQDVTKEINVAVAVNGEYDMSGNFTAFTGADTSDWLAQVGAQALYNKMASLGLAWRGWDGYTAGGLQVQVWAMPTATIELLGIVGLGLDDDVYAETFDSLELTVKYTMGKVLWYLGLLWNNDGGRMIAKEWADFTVTGNETTAIYMRGKVAL